MNEQIGHTVNLYRGTKEQIEDICSEFIESPEQMNHAFVSFFGIEPGRVSEQDYDDFKVYLGYSLKRLINADLHKHGIQTVAEAQSFLEQYNLGEAILLHDVAHSVATFKKQGGEIGASVVPVFFRTEDGHWLDTNELVLEESHALIWANIFGGDKPLSTLILTVEGRVTLAQNLARDGRAQAFPEIIAHMSQALQADVADFGGYVQLFQTIVYDAVEIAVCNEGRLRNQNQNSDTVPYNEADELQKLHRIVTELKSNPDPELIDSLRTIYDNQNNDRVLYDEFKRTCSALIENVRGRTRQQS
jgi:hypothetical protein